MNRLQRVAAHAGPRLTRDLASRFTTVSPPHASPPDPPVRPTSHPAASSEPSTQMLLSLPDARSRPSPLTASPLAPLMAAMLQAQSWSSPLAMPPSSATAYTSSLDSLLSVVGQQQQQTSTLSAASAMQSLLMSLQQAQQQQQAQQPQLQLAMALQSLQSAQLLAGLQADRAAPAQLHATSQPQEQDQMRLQTLQHVLRLVRQPVSEPMALSQATGRAQGVFCSSPCCLSFLPFSSFSSSSVAYCMRPHTARSVNPLCAAVSQRPPHWPRQGPLGP